MTKRIRIFFINCPTLATDAVAFLLLAQNKVQTVLQFEVHHFWIYSKKEHGNLTGWWNKKRVGIGDRYERFVPWLEHRNRALFDLRAAPAFRDCFNTNTWSISVREAIARYDLWVANRPANNFDSASDPTIVITETGMQENYISFCDKDIAIISAAEWKQFFKPASALEYILVSVQRLSLRLCYGSVIGSHYPTRGCLWDYDINVSDVRISAFLGFLCETCRNGLSEKIKPNEYDEIVKLMENHWVGDRESPSSIAGILAKNYKYDLSRSLGLNPGFVNRLTQSLPPWVGKSIVDIGKWLVILLLTIWIASWFPSIAKLLNR